MALQPIAPEKLRWQVEDSQVPGNSTRDLAPAGAVIETHPAARQALAFALQVANGGNHDHIFVRGEAGSGRRRLVQSVMEAVHPEAASTVDFCFVHNFAQPDRPRLIRLPGGQGRRFQNQVQEIGQFVRDRLDDALQSAPVQNRIRALTDRAEREIKAVTGPFERALRKDGLMLVRSEVGRTARVEIHMRRMDKPVSAEELSNLVETGQADAEELESFNRRRERHQAELDQIATQVNTLFKRSRRAMDKLLREEARRILEDLTEPLVQQFPAAGVRRFIAEVIQDVLEKRIGLDVRHLADPTMLYGVNLINGRREDPDDLPLVWEHQPTPTNLVGTVDPAWLGDGRVVSSYRGIRGGSLIQAHGGFLVLDAREVRAEPAAWRVLMRALRNGRVEIAPPELGWPYSAQSLKPESIPVQVRVILIGDEEIWATLDREDPEFARHFRMLADIEPCMERTRESIQLYGQILAQEVENRSLPHFDRSGIAAVVESGARRSSRPGQLSARFDLLTDLAREAALIARRDQEDEVRRAHVQQALRNQFYWHTARSREHIRAVCDGRHNLPLRGRVQGQATALASLRHGAYCAGHPVRIGAVAVPAHTWQLDAPGSLEFVTPALLGHLLRLEVPLTMQVGIHGNGLSIPLASFQETDLLDLGGMCAVISQLAGVALRQDLVLAGGVDAHGRLVPTIAINEKIEAIHEICQRQGQTGNQGVIIPRANAVELMLDPELVKACANDSFQVLAADNIFQVLEMLSGIHTGTFSEDDGDYPEDSLLHRARHRALTWWRTVSGAAGD